MRIFGFRSERGTKSGEGRYLSSIRFGTSISLFMIDGLRALVLFEFKLCPLRPVRMLGLSDSLRDVVTFIVVKCSLPSPSVNCFSVSLKVTFLGSGCLKVYPYSTRDSILRLSLSNCCLSLSCAIIFRFSSAINL